MSVKKLMAWVLVAVCAGAFMTGCEDNDSDDSLSDTGSGSATVSGILESISGEWVPAAVQGITVDLVQDGKSILRTLTQANGRFTFYNVPAGEFTLVFHIKDTELTRDISVKYRPNGSTPDDVVLGRVRVSPKGEILDVVEVEIIVSVESDPATSSSADPAPQPAWANISPAAGDFFLFQYDWAGGHALTYPGRYTRGFQVTGQTNFQYSSQYLASGPPPAMPWASDTPWTYTMTSPTEGVLELFYAHFAGGSEAWHLTFTGPGQGTYTLIDRGNPATWIIPQGFTYPGSPF